LDIATKLLVESLTFSTFVEKFIYELHYKHKSRNDNLDSFLEVYKELGQESQAAQLASEDTKLKSETEAAIKNFFETSVERINPVSSLLNEFNSLVKQYLIEKN
jgi:hypothetical protein